MPMNIIINKQVWVLLFSGFLLLLCFYMVFIDNNNQRADYSRTSGRPTLILNFNCSDYFPGICPSRIVKRPSIRGRKRPSLAGKGRRIACSPPPFKLGDHQHNDISEVHYKGMWKKKRLKVFAFVATRHPRDTGNRVGGNQMKCRLESQ